MTGEPRWMIDGYAEWLAGEGVQVVSGLAVDLTAVETSPWARLGTDAVIVHLDARGDFCNLYVSDLAPGQSTAPRHHLYEEVVFVVDGRGSTELVTPAGPRTFEWGPGSLFALPVNAVYRHFNASGRNRARLACTTNLPMVMKLFRNKTFVFETPFDFTERYGVDRFLRGGGNLIPAREQRHMWETNLVPDLLAFDQLQDSPGRGAGSANIQFVLADGTMHAHGSEIPAGNYKKAHVHGDGYHILQLSGQGYSLYWAEGQAPERVDWKYGVLHSPAAGIWHQHFNLSDVPARYVATSFGSIRYPFLRERQEIIERRYTERGAFQIEYEDEDPAFRQTFIEERAKFLKQAADTPSVLS